MISRNGAAWQPEVWSEETQEQIDYWSKKLDEATEQAYIGFFCTASCVFLHRITQISLFQVAFIGSLSYLVTSVVRKVFEDYTIVRISEREALRLIRWLPYGKVLTVVVACVFYKYLPPVSMLLAIGLGVFQGLTHEIHILEQASATFRNRS